MKQAQFGLWAATATVGVMFAIVIWLGPLLQAVGTPLKVSAVIVAAAASFGVYRGIAAALYSVFAKSLVVRRWLLGRDFVEGTWVGFYIHEGQTRYIVEFFDQSSGELRISGREFNEDGNIRAHWTSHACGLDERTDTLVYSYRCDVYDRKHQQQGVASFVLQRPHTGAPAQAIDGYAADLIDGDKDPSSERKVSDRAVPTDVALDAARKMAAANARVPAGLQQGHPAAQQG